MTRLRGHHGSRKLPRERSKLEILEELSRRLLVGRADSQSIGIERQRGVVTQSDQVAAQAGDVRVRQQAFPVSLPGDGRGREQDGFEIAVLADQIPGPLLPDSGNARDVVG